MGRHRFAWLLVVGLLACRGEETRIYDVRGVVRGVQPSARQLVVHHEDIEGLMPAMTMTFYVERSLLPRLEVGQRIDGILDRLCRVGHQPREHEQDTFYLALFCQL